MSVSVIMAEQFSREEMEKLKADLALLQQSQSQMKELAATNEKLRVEMENLKKAKTTTESVKVNTTTHVKIPTLKPGMTFKDYENQVNIWKVASQVAPERLAVTLIGELPERDKYGGLQRHVMEHIGHDKLMEADALEKMMEKLKDFLQESKFVRGG